MAKKPDITTIASGYYSRQALNSNFENLRDKFDNTLSLDGSTPNAMGADFDVNGYRILNAGQIDTDALYLNGIAVTSASDVDFQTTYLTASYTGDGSTVAYSLTANPQSEGNVSIYVDGVYQNKDTFSLSGTTVTFSEAPPLNAAIEIVYPTNTDTLNGSLSSAITYNQGGTGAQDRTVKAKLQETVSVKDFGAVGDGVTDDTAAIQAAVDSGNPVFFPSGTYALDGTIDIGAGAKLYGSGIGKSILFQTNAGSAHVIDALSTSTKGGIEIVGLTIDCNGVDAGFVAQYVSNISIRYCEFKNSPYWLVNIGKSDSAVSTIVNDQIEIVGCSFSNITQTYEQLLIFNSINVVVRDCYFEVAPNGNGLGFWQNVDRADVVNCVFNNLSIGAYYSLSTNNIRFSGCSFTDCTGGLRGANLSDNGNFGATHAYNISVFDCTFKSNSGAPCQLGAVNGGIVSGCVFDTNDEYGLLIDDGAIISPDNAQCYNVIVSNCLFYNNNESNISSANAPAILFTSIGGNIGATISGCQFWDTRGTPRQLYPITFNNAFVWDDIVISNCTLNAYSGATSIGLAGGASVGSSVIAVDNSNMTTTIATGVKRRDVRAMWQDFGDGQAQLVSTSTAIARVTAAAGNVAIFDLGNATDPDGGRVVYDSGNNFEIYTASTARVRVQSDGVFRPSTDNTQALGSGSFRWSEVFAGTGTINTSDATEKQQFTDISDAEKAVASALKTSLKKFKFNDAVSRKGDAARWHFGVVAQEVEAAFSAAGLNASDYGVFCVDTWDAQEEIIDEETGHVVQEAREAGSRLGVRYDELFAFILAAM